MERYYRVRPTAHPDQHGQVVRIRDGKLEICAGETPIEKIGCVVTPQGEPNAKQGYFLTQISKAEAQRLRENAASRTPTQMIADPVSDSSVSNGRTRYRGSLTGFF